MTTEAGTNTWRSINFDPTALVRTLTADRRHHAVETFAAVALLPTDTGIYVAGIIDAGKAAWGAVLLVDRAGEITSVGHGVPVGLSVLEQAPDGTLWAGGQGVYRLQGGEWIKAWSAQD